MSKVSAYTRILIIKPGAIGDLLQLTPVIRGLSHQYPGSKITMLTGTSATATLFQYNNHVSETIVYDKRSRCSKLVQLWHKIRSQRYDLVLQFQRSNLKAWLLASAALPSRILVYKKSNDPSMHVVDNYLSTLQSLGISVSDRHLDLFVGKEDDQYAATLFAENGLINRPVIAINPGASHAVNRWSVSKFAALTDALITRFNARVIIVGGDADVPLADGIIALASQEPITLCGRTTLLQLGAILKKCAILISGDTGPLHLATAVGTKVIALFGAADPARTGPVGVTHTIIKAKDLACVPCRSRNCRTRDAACMEVISIEDVVEAVNDLLGEEMK